MTPSEAFALVHRYGAAIREIKSLTKEIAEHLGKCKGVNPDTDPIDRVTHLSVWYTPSNDEFIGRHWNKITSEYEKKCPHCYAVHLAVEKRKAARKDLGIVRRLISMGTKCKK